MALSDKALQAQWAGSGDFWPAIPDGSGSIVCIQTRVRKAKDERVLPNQIWPEVVCASTLFGLSACNPRGRIVPDDVNQKQNNLMKRDITETISAQWPMATFWDSASVWENGGREPGFIVALSHRKNQSDDIDKFRDWIVNLAKNYDQGAIYEYRCINRRLFRSTISVLTPESEADVEIVIASRSVLRQAE
mmetsp:Transcript_6437/g.9285  ORF Transcript_6437/g.9285 Transcript_6437/m.9285 type:complete len:191 (-) Transcript_6437:77-649(-)